MEATKHQLEVNNYWDTHMTSIISINKQIPNLKTMFSLSTFTNEIETFFFIKLKPLYINYTDREWRRIFCFYLFLSQTFFISFHFAITFGVQWSEKWVIYTVFWIKKDLDLPRVPFDLLHVKNKSNDIYCFQWCPSFLLMEYNMHVNAKELGS